MAEKIDVLTWRQTLEVLNEDAAPLVIVLEPWAEPFVIPPHSSVDVVAFAPGVGSLEVEQHDNRLTVWGWTGSTVHVLHDGQELEPAFLSSAETADIGRRRMQPPIIRNKDCAPGV